MTRLSSILPLKTWLILAFVVIVVLGLLSVRAACTAAERAKAERNVAVATGDALDKVAKDVPVIRQDQKEKEDAVENIPGADQPLPDGFGAELERLRRGGRDSHSRQPEG